MPTLVVNVREMPYDVYIGRPSTVIPTVKFHFGNPFTHKIEKSLHKYTLIKVDTREEAVKHYADWLAGKYPKVEPERREWILDNLHTLKDKKLGCFCKPLACHGDVLVDLIKLADHLETLK